MGERATIDNWCCALKFHSRLSSRRFIALGCHTSAAVCLSLLLFVSLSCTLSLYSVLSMEKRGLISAKTSAMAGLVSRAADPQTHRQ